MSHARRDEDLARFRYHTGATLREAGTGRACPRLYRDIGPEAMARFLAGRLDRLAGPMAPILYSRTATYREPYRDYEPVGRLVFLTRASCDRGSRASPDVYVAPRGTMPVRHRRLFALRTSIRNTPKRSRGCHQPVELRDALGGRLMTRR